MFAMSEGLQSSAGRDVSDSSPNVNGDAVDGASIRYKLREGMLHYQPADKPASRASLK